MQEQETFLQIAGACAVFTSSQVLTEHDLLIGGGKILGISQREASLQKLEQEKPFAPKIIDAAGKIIVPGFVDIHVHATGGGGESSFRSRCPEATLSELLDAGITTIVGVLGTDSLSRSLENLFAKVKGLTEQGITGFMYTGAYAVPSPTLTGAVKRDMVLIDPVVGCKLAISDHRGSYPTRQELIRLLSEVRVGGLTAGKQGVLYCHMGSDKAGLEPLWQVLEHTSIPIKHIVPTHMARTPDLLEDGVRWIEAGGRMDFAGSPEAQVLAVVDLVKRNVPLTNISISSDSYGSLPVFGPSGEVIDYAYAKPQELYDQFRDLHLQHQLPLETILPLFTCNPAASHGLSGKGRIAIGADADFLVLDPITLEIELVFARGKCLKGDLGKYRRQYSQG